MAGDKLYLNGINDAGDNVMTTNLGFVRTLNGNNTVNKISLENNTPSALLKALRETIGEDKVSYATPSAPDNGNDGFVEMYNDVIDVRNQPEITSVTFTPAGTIQEGQASAAINATVGTLATVGGTSPFVYAFVTDATYGVDNSKFTISGSTLKVGSTALTAGTLKIALKSTDTNGKTMTVHTEITVNAAA
jgi:hypothetical protein